MIKEHIFLGIGWILFCILHSVLASLWFKNRMQLWLGKSFVYYRAFYSSFALVTFGIIILQQVATSSPYLFVPMRILEFIGGLIGFVGLCAMSVSLSKYIFNIYGFNRLFGKKNEPILIEKGIHSIVRHPLYFGTFLLIWGVWLIYPWISLLISNLIITIYTLIGIQLEEKKLELEFGEKYVNYKKRTPMIIPQARKKV